MPPGTVIWLTGPPGLAKSEIAYRAAEELDGRGVEVEVLAEAEVAEQMFETEPRTDEERLIRVLRLATLAGLLARHGVVVLVASSAPSAEHRRRAGERTGEMIEVFITGQVEASGYEPPPEPALTLDAGQLGPEAAAAGLLAFLDKEDDSAAIKQRLADLGYL